MPPPEKPSRGTNVSERRTSISGNRVFRFACERCHLSRGGVLAFTLAEVLITLGIIGVVASITLPALINNFKNQQYVNQLKKSYSEIGNTFKFMMAKEEVESLDETEFFRNFPGETQNSSRVPEYLDTALGQYFNVVKNCHKHDTTCNSIKYKSLHNAPLTNDLNDYNFYTAGGQIIYMGEFRRSRLPDQYNKDAQLAGCPAIIGVINIDVNGEKGPNKYGRDYFSYRLCVNGKLLAEGSKELAMTAGDNYTGYWWKTSYSCSGNNKGIGHGCAGRVMENGWKMDY